jgi:hypothetical protein
MIRNNALREGDGLLVTSHLGHNPGYEKTFQSLAHEFELLGVTAREDKRDLYRRAHPSFTIYRALGEANFRDEMCVRCFGFVEYYHTSPMGLYGYALSQGPTSFRDLIRDTPQFDIKSR